MKRKLFIQCKKKTNLNAQNSLSLDNDTSLSLENDTLRSIDNGDSQSLNNNNLHSSHNNLPSNQKIFDTELETVKEEEKDNYPKKIKYYDVPPTRDCNMYSFICDFDSYKTRCDDFLVPKETWWKHDEKTGYTPTFLPNDTTFVFTMSHDEKLIWRSLNSDRHTLVSGIAGSGKSFLLKQFLSHIEGTAKVVVTSFTAAAATNINGITIHKALGLGLVGDPAAEFKKISNNKNRYAKTISFLKDTDIMVIDEISMVTIQLFTTLDFLFRKVRNNPVPFGGVKLICFGDFAQLGPVVKNKKPNDKTYVFECNSWKNMKFTRICLDRNYRQTEGPLVQILTEIRQGYISAKSKQLLQSRVGADVTIHSDKYPTKKQKKTPLENFKVQINGNIVKDEKTEEEIEREMQNALNTANESEEESDSPDSCFDGIDYEIKPVDICALKYQSLNINNSKLEELKNSGQQVRKFLPFCCVQKRDGVPRITSKHEIDAKKLTQYYNDKDARKKLENIFPIFELNLAVGAQVILRCNSYFSDGLYNGSLGVVTDIGRTCVLCRFVKNGVLQRQVTRIERFEFKAIVNDTACITMMQFPLSLAYATTIHKSQGQTLDSCRINIDSSFDGGQAYVALSRVRELENLSLKNFNPNNILVNKKALEFETFKI